MTTPTEHTINDDVRRVLSGKSELEPRDGQYATIRCAVDAQTKIATITLARPEVRNAQNARLVIEVDRCLRELAFDNDVHVVIIDAEGPHFSAGHDLNTGPVREGYLFRAESAEDRTLWEYEIMYKLMKNIHEFPKPTIAQVQGACIAAGLMLTNMCDLVVAAEDAWFSNPTARMASAGTEVNIEVFLMGARRAKELLYTNQHLSAQGAREAGLVNRVVPAAELAAATRALAKTIADQPPRAIQLTKRSMNLQLQTAGMWAAAEAAFYVHQVTHASAEARVGVYGFLLDGDPNRGGPREYFKRFHEEGDDGAQRG